MPIIKLQGKREKELGGFYEYDSSSIPLGEGGMGKVYKGLYRDVTSGRTREVAIKVLYTDLPQHVIVRARREASVQIKNDSLVEMLGFLEIPDRDYLGQPIVRYYVVSEYLQGVTLEDLLNGKVSDTYGNVISFAQEMYGKYVNDSYRFALLVIRNLLSGLMALHDAGYIHRDIDPSNIMVTAGGHVKLIDFGIAKKINGNNTKESTYTVSGQFLGKPKYAAPELVRGLVDSQDARTDLYSVGILLYQLIVGKVPFDGEMVDVLDKQLNSKLPLQDLKQAQVRKVVRKATEKSKSARYQSAAEFRVAVDKLVPLAYPEKSKGLKAFAVSGAVAAAVLALILIAGNDKGQPVGSQGVSSKGQTGLYGSMSGASLSYEDAVAMMKDNATVNDGFELLKSLAHNNDPKALFLLSRIYFKSGEESDNVGQYDSLATLRQTLGVVIDNRLAHNLLIRAEALDESNYRVQYELGCDYKSNRRGTVRQSDSAYYYLSKALKNATESNDMEYRLMAEEKMVNLKSPAK